MKLNNPSSSHLSKEEEEEEKTSHPSNPQEIINSQLSSHPATQALSRPTDQEQDQDQDHDHHKTPKPSYPPNPIPSGNLATHPPTHPPAQMHPATDVTIQGYMMY